MPTFSDDKSFEKFKKETEVFSSSKKTLGDEKNKVENPPFLAGFLYGKVVQYTIITTQETCT